MVLPALALLPFAATALLTLVANQQLRLAEWLAGATAAAGFATLAALAPALLDNIVGSTDLDRVLAAGAQIRAHPAYEVAVVLVLLGGFTKSAQFPFHFWLPHAMGE